MSEQKYTRVDELKSAIENIPTETRQDAMMIGNALLKLDMATAYTPAEIMAQQWVPVSERLPSPEDCDWMLGIVTADIGVLHLRNAITLVGYDQIEGWFLREQPTVDAAVTHWMPLPPLPQQPKEAHNE